MITFVDFFRFIIHSIEAGLGNHYFLLAITSTLFLLKITLLSLLVIRGLRSAQTSWPWIFLTLLLTGAACENIAWIFKLLQLTFFPTIDKRILHFAIRFAWGFAVIQYQSLALFIESLLEKNFTFNIRQKVFVTISTACFVVFMCMAFLYITTTNRPSFEIDLMGKTTLYIYFPLMISTLYFTFKKMRSKKLPLILKKQVNLLLKVLILPWWLCDLLQVWPFNFNPGYVASSYAAVAISNMLLTYVIYYGSRRVIGLRFLNFKNHVQAPIKYNFIDHFKELLEQLSQATNIGELSHITQSYFKDVFSVPLRKVGLFIRKTPPTDIANNEIEHYIPNEALHREVEGFLTSVDKEVKQVIQNAKILIYDEIAFSNFYEKDPHLKTILAFLENIKADIFLPVYEKQKMIAYIIVERNARTDSFYSDMERDEMIVFVSYLSNVIHLLQNRNLDTLIHQEKELKEELYSKHQEINQYKESVRSFLHTSSQKKIGIIFYKNRRFAFGNQAARELVGININVQSGHPIAQLLRKIARQVLDYKAPQTHFANDLQGNRIICSGVLNLEKNNVIITVYRPEISDIITKQLDQLKDPSKWDYLLYLETTQSGKLINQLIPGSGPTLLEFKIDLLKVALSKKAVLLEMAEEDLLPTVELLHHVSLRDNLHTLTLQAPEKNFETATKLFGLNPIFSIAAEHAEPLLKKLSPNGTLFIKNIQFLSKESQEHLAEFIRTGFYRTFKSDQKHTAQVRVICSSTQDLFKLAQDKKFSQNLFNALKQTTITMPSLLTLPEQELKNLVQGFGEQALKTKTFKNLLELSPKEHHRLAEQRPVSLSELKTRVQQLLVAKSKKQEVYHETQFDPAYDISDPDLVEAARLGKHALRDPKIMALLWDKFKNQNKIATFLGVNRSSVNRRFKKYNLI